MVSLCYPDTFACSIGEDVDAADKEEGGAEVDRQCDDDVSQEIGPAAEIGADPAAPRRTDHVSLIVDTSSGRIYRCDLTERDGETQDDEADSYPAPDHRGWTTTNKRIIHSRRQTIGDGGKHERHKRDLPRRPRSSQLRRIPEYAEQVVG